MGDVAGSGKKPRPQKHTGRARQGNKRASINYHGGKTFGAVPKDFKYPLNKKVRLLAMKSLLSSRLMENRIILIQNPSLEVPKTKELAKLMKIFGNSTVLVLTEKDLDEHFKKASQNLTKVTVAPAIGVGVKPVLKNEFLMLTTKGLEELEKSLLSREENYFRNKKVKRPPLPYDSWLPQKKKKQLIEIVKEKVKLDQIAEAKILSYSLKKYLEDLKRYESTRLKEKEKETQKTTESAT